MAEEAINNNSSVQEQWGQICSQLKVEVGETAFDSWLKPLTPGAFNDGIMNICVPTRFMRNWVITHYSDRIHKIWEKKNPAIKSVNFVVQAVQDESKGLTVLEVQTPDRPGLLSIVANIFVDLDVQVVSAKITTLGDRVEDMFYITDADGQPLTETQALADRICQELDHHIERESA